MAHRSRRGLGTAQLVADAAAGRLPFWGGAIAYTGTMKESILARNGGPDAYAVVDRLWREAGELRPGADEYQRMTYLELRQRLAELLLMRVDKMCMATSVEARVPFLDKDLVEFAIALPPEMKVRDGTGKWLLKKAVAGTLVPEELVYRRKMGFAAPVAEWFRGELGERARSEIRRSSLAERGLLDYDRIDDLWGEHRSGRRDWSIQLWNLYNVSAWHDHWVAGRALGAAA